MPALKYSAGVGDTLKVAAPSSGASRSGFKIPSAKVRRERCILSRPATMVSAADCALFTLLDASLNGNIYKNCLTCDLGEPYRINFRINHPIAFCLEKALQDISRLNET